MKKLLVLLSFVLINCGSGIQQPASSNDCTSEIVGSWTGTTIQDSISILSSGVFVYNGLEECTSTGTFACPGDITEGTLAVTITTASASLYCLPAGSYICVFAVGESDLTFTCANDSFAGMTANYTR